MSLLSHLLLPADGDPPTCNLQWICKQLGHDGSEASQVAYVRGLIDDHGFPRPFPHLAHGGGLSSDIHAIRSQWLRAGVEAWLADFLPPAGAAALDAAAQRAAAEDMDRMAGNLRLVGGTEA
jgi:hypothetical protein